MLFPHRAKDLHLVLIRKNEGQENAKKGLCTICILFHQQEKVSFHLEKKYTNLMMNNKRPNLNQIHNCDLYWHK